MKVLVIGGRGNLGSAYCNYLQSCGVTASVFDLPSDISRIKTKEIVELSPDLIVNFSMIADLKSSQLNLRAKDYEVNVKGLENLVNAIVDLKVPLIQVSTREVIGLRDFRSDTNILSTGFDDLRRVSEDEPCLPLHSYGKTKLVAEYLALGYDRGVVIRLNTPYTDSWQSGKGLVSVLVKKSRLDGKVRLDNSGKAVRDPLHINDLADLTLKIYEHRPYQELFNAAGGDENIITLKEICIGANPDVAIESGSENNDYGFLMDIRKASNLGWEPRTKIRTWLQSLHSD